MLGTAEVSPICRFLSFRDLTVFRCACATVCESVGRGPPELHAARQEAIRRIERVWLWYGWFLLYRTHTDPYETYLRRKRRVEGIDSADELEMEEPPVPRCFHHLRRGIRRQLKLEYPNAHRLCSPVPRAFHPSGSDGMIRHAHGM